MAGIRAQPGLPRTSHLLWYVLAMLLTGALAGCGGGGSRYRGSGGYAAGSGDYGPPGSPDDPWGPYIRQAADRFGVPQRWIREVMRQESGGHQYLNGRLTTSSSGAMGLMQIMPATYAELRARYGLGSDPYDPHDNIMAGAAYIREMYDRFGYPEFLAAYNAGPGRVSDYLAGGGRLPSETVNYVASIAPRIADAPGPSGPSPAVTEDQRIAVAEQTPAPAPAPAIAATPSVLRVAMVAPSPSACDPDAAYDPAAPCAPAVQQAVVVEPAAPVTMAPIYDPEDQPGYVPPAPQRSPEPARIARAPLPPRQARSPRFQLVALGPTQPPLAAGRGQWSVQVGAFASPASARAIAAAARFAAPDLLGHAHVEIPTKAMVGAVLYRARLSGISPAAAAQACARLSERGMACVPVGPGRVW